MRYWELHGHSRYSALDALPSVGRRVDRAVELGYPALGLTDHGTIAGAVQHYQACRKAGIEPLIGFEAYVAYDRNMGARPDTMHAVICAVDEVGWRNLVELNNRAWQQFRWKPVLDLGDIAEFADAGMLDGLIMTGGCWFGLVPRMIREHPGPGVLNMISALSVWFDGRFFIELHNHEVRRPDQDDRAHAEMLHSMARSMYLPMILAQDSHYLLPEDQGLHDAFKTLNSWNTADPDSATFPGDGYHMVDTQWMRRHHSRELFRDGMAGLSAILDSAHLRIPELEKYRLRMPDLAVSGDAQNELAIRCRQELAALLVDMYPKHRRRYHDRLAEELDVVEATGFAGYLLLVAKVTSWMGEQGIFYAVRGSAVGSLLCFLLGITEIDPVQWDLSFDRFLSRERIKPPDIDVDIEHERRPEVIAHVLEMYDARQIGTTGQMKVTVDENGDLAGGVMVQWRKRARAIGADPAAPVPDVWRARMLTLVRYNGMRGNEPVEPPVRSFGVHPGGVVIAPDAAALAEVPTQWIASSGTTITAFEGNDIEELGLIKLDLLGLKTLTVLRVCAEMTRIGWTEMPLNDRSVYASMVKDTTGLFQLEGWSATKGIRRMRPTRIADVIAAMALFRPAARDSGATDSYLRRRAGEEPIVGRHEVIAQHTSKTYGVLVYQEQALGILKDLGMTVDEVEKARKAIKASNANVGNAAQAMRDLEVRLRQLGTEAGMSPADIAWLNDAMQAYAGYSFNQAHATAYGLTAYATAWYRKHFPVAFWTGVLRAHDGDSPKHDNAPKPEVLYAKAAREAGVRICPAHVNHSGLSYSSDGRVIYKSLRTIEGVGPVAAAEVADKAPFTSLDDMARRLSTRKVSGVRDLGKGVAPQVCPGNIHALHEAGALEGLERETTTKEE